MAGARVAVTTLRRRFERHWSQYVLELQLPATAGCLSVTSGADGRFALPDLPVGSVVALRVSAPGHGTVKRYQVASASPDLRVFLSPEATVSGRVVHGERPVPGVLLAIGREQATSAADGTFTIGRLTPGSHTLALPTTPEGLVPVCPTRLVLARGEHRANVQIALQEGVPISGHCREGKTKAPVAEASLVITCPASSGGYILEREIRSAPDGSWRACVPPGEVQVYYRDDFREPPLWSCGQRSQRSQRRRLAAGEAVGDIDFALEALPTVRGQVLTPEGAPAAGVEVGTLGCWGNGVAPADFFDTVTDVDGRFSFRVLVGVGRWGPPYTIVARDTVRNLAACANVADPAREASILLRPGAWVALRAVDPRGKPVAALPVAVRVGDLTSYPRLVPYGVTAADGRLRLGPLPPGQSLHVTLGDYYDRFVVPRSDGAEGEIVLKSGEERVVPDLVVNLAGRTVAGWVSDAAQKPLPAALVFVEGVAEAVQTDAAGHFEVGGIALSGKVDVVAAHPTEALFDGTVLDPDWGLTPGLVPGPPVSATGRVVTPRGEPIPTTRGGFRSDPFGMFLDELSERREAAGLQRSWFADAQGRWRADGLVAGLSYKLWFADFYDKFGFYDTGFAAEAGKTVELGDVVLQPR